MNGSSERVQALNEGGCGGVEKFVAETQQILLILAFERHARPDSSMAQKISANRELILMISETPFVPRKATRSALTGFGRAGPLARSSRPGCRAAT